MREIEDIKPTSIFRKNKLLDKLYDPFEPVVPFSRSLLFEKVEGTENSNSALRPVADFSADTLEGFAPLLVNFTDLSTNSPTSWLWDFGDGNTSIDQNPSNTYNEGSSFTVQLTATNSFGSGIEIKEDYIVATNPS